MFICVVAWLATLPARSQALEFTREPIPRVEIGGHSADIKGVTVCGQGVAILTVSEDKTTRVWRTDRSATLLTTLRVVVDATLEGQLYTADCSRDGQWLAIGGFTSDGADRAENFYLYLANAIKPDMHNANRLGPLPAAPSRIRFSPDGRWIAVSMFQSHSVFIIDWGSLLARTTPASTKIDLDRDDEALGIEFSAHNELTLSTRKGWVRIFTAADNFKRDRNTQLPNSPRLKEPRYSPDGKLLLLGSELEPKAYVLDSRTLALVAAATAPEPARGLYAVEWSADGRRILAGGELGLGGQGVLYQFDLDRPNNATALLRSERLIRDIRRLPDGAFAFVTAEPEVGVLESDNRVRWRKRSTVISGQRDAGSLRASRDGRTIQVRAASTGNQWLQFTVGAEPAQALKTSPKPDDLLAPAITRTPNAEVIVSPDSESVQLNLYRLALDATERYRSHAFSPSGDALLLGSSWALRRFDMQGKEQWRISLPVEVDQVLVTTDQNFVVAALSDGTLHWYRLADGGEVLSLLALRNGIDWIAWIPSGYYVSSPKGDSLLGWHVNREAMAGVSLLPYAEFFRAAQFERLLYRKDLVAEYFTRAGRIELDTLVQRGGFDIRRLDDIAPPELKIAQTASNKPSSADAILQIDAKARKLPISDWNVYVDGIPQLNRGARQAALNSSRGRELKESVSITVPHADTRVRVEVMAANSGSANNAQSVTWEDTFLTPRAPRTKAKGKLFIAAIGVGRFADSKIKPLRYAWRDAQELANTLKATAATQYDSVHTLVLADQTGMQTTRASIQSALEPFLQQAGPDDAVLVFLASHGFSSLSGDYYFVPSDGRFEDIERAHRGEATSGSLMPWDQVFGALSGAAGRRALIVDTCSSGALIGGFDAMSLAKRSMSASFDLLTASAGNEESQESEAQQHGLFTYGLLEALRSGYDPDSDGMVSLQDAFELASQRVEELRNRAVGTQTPQMTVPEGLAALPLASARAKSSIATNAIPVAFSLNFPSLTSH